MLVIFQIIATLLIISLDTRFVECNNGFKL
jgi:hypothetical protein